MMSYFWFTICLLLLFYVFRHSIKRKKYKQKLCGSNYALNLIINTDLSMSKGKVVSQIAHAMSAVISHLYQNKEIYEVWQSSGETKIVLKGSLEELKEVIKIARENNIWCKKVVDAGRTQIPAGSTTVVAVGPAPREKLSLVTGHLKLL